MKVQEIVIIGLGPSGIAAAIQLKRYGHKPLILEMNKFGGLLLNANRIDNYPGFPGGISGIKLVKLFKKQFESFGLNFEKENVLEIDFENNLFIIKTDKRKIKAKIIIVATGTIPKKIENLNIPQTAYKKVFYEIVPILDVKKKKIAIVGGGDAAFDYALNLAKKNYVYIFNRSKKAKGMKILIDECLSDSNIDYFQNSMINKIKFVNDMLILNCNINNKNRIFFIDILVFAVGRKANNNILSERLKQSRDELIDSKRLFFIGDFKNGDYRQVSISIADGIRTAMQINFN